MSLVKLPSGRFFDPEAVVDAQDWSLEGVTPNPGEQPYVECHLSKDVHCRFYGKDRDVVMQHLESRAYDARCVGRDEWNRLNRRVALEAKSLVAGIRIEGVPSAEDLAAVEEAVQALKDAEAP